ncbi:hypothetical protein CYMTET_53144 [Cymbomonas tetramitiformis]|uniref:PKD/REJ-like domain-containing protein n=1 Tax=Cymbomonas tetramitiformis TaxID=36881 RepID=A0AAE0BHT9_9CHLO|nr:hypothetical protein CYMTET_53144 [Cymbomonas tetramitiformis]
MELQAPLERFSKSLSVAYLLLLASCLLAPPSLAATEKDAGPARGYAHLFDLDQTSGTPQTPRLLLDGTRRHLLQTPTVNPTTTPTATPTSRPTSSPTTASPTISPTTAAPSASPTTAAPSASPTTASPTTVNPSVNPTTSPTASPTASPTTAAPSIPPTVLEFADNDFYLKFTSSFREQMAAAAGVVVDAVYVDEISAGSVIVASSVRFPQDDLAMAKNFSTLVNEAVASVFTDPEFSIYGNVSTVASATSAGAEVIVSPPPPSPCFNNDVECSDFAAGFTCGDCPIGYLGDGVDCQLCSLSALVQGSTAHEGLLLASQELHVSATAQLEDDGCTISSGISFRWSVTAQGYYSSALDLDPRVTYSDTAALRLPSGYLRAGPNPYLIQVAACVRGFPGDMCGHAEISVIVQASPLVSAISGGNGTVGLGTLVTLDGSVSHDPDLTTGSLSFHWECRPDDPGQECQDQGGEPVVLPNASAVTVALSPGNYHLFLTVTKLDRTPATSTATLQVVQYDEAAALPFLALQPMTGVLDVESRVVLEGALLHGSGEVDSDDYSLRWTSPEKGVNLCKSEHAASPCANATQLVLQPALLRAHAGAVLRLSLEATHPSGAKLSAGLSLLLGAPPSGGLALAAPLAGVSLTTTFTLEVSGWHDPHLPLQYHFTTITSGDKADIQELEVPLTLGYQPLSRIEVKLPVGNPEHDFHLSLRAYIRNAEGATTIVDFPQPVTVEQPYFEDGDALEAALATHVPAMIDAFFYGQYDTSLQNVLSLTSTLNLPYLQPAIDREFSEVPDAEEDFTRSLFNGYSVVFTSSNDEWLEATVGSIEDSTRAVMLRRVMSFVLQELYMNVGPRPQSIAAVGHALSFVLGAPEQMDEALYVQCQAFVRAMMKQTRHINEASAQALLSAIGNLMLNAHLETTLPSAEGKIEDLKGYLNDIGKILLDEMIAEELSISLAASAVVKMTLRQGSTKPHSWVFHEAITTYDGTTFNPISYQASIAGDELRQSDGDILSPINGTSSLVLEGLPTTELVQVNNLIQGRTFQMPVRYDTEALPSDSSVACVWYDETEGRYRQEGCVTIPLARPRDTSAIFSTVWINESSMHTAWEIIDDEIGNCPVAFYDFAHQGGGSYNFPTARVFLGDSTSRQECELENPNNSKKCFWDRSTQSFKGTGCVRQDKVSCMCVQLNEVALAIVKNPVLELMDPPIAIPAWSQHRYLFAALAVVIIGGQINVLLFSVWTKIRHGELLRALMSKHCGFCLMSHSSGKRQEARTVPYWVWTISGRVDTVFGSTSTMEEMAEFKESTLELLATHMGLPYMRLYHALPMFTIGTSAAGKSASSAGKEQGKAYPWEHEGQDAATPATGNPLQKMAIASPTGRNATAKLPPLEQYVYPASQVWLTDNTMVDADFINAEVIEVDEDAARVKMHPPPGGWRKEPMDRGVVGAEFTNMLGVSRLHPAELETGVADVLQLASAEASLPVTLAEQWAATSTVVPAPGSNSYSREFLGRRQCKIAPALQNLEASEAGLNEDVLTFQSVVGTALVFAFLHVNQVVPAHVLNEKREAVAHLFEISKIEGMSKQRDFTWLFKHFSALIHKGITTPGWYTRAVVFKAALLQNEDGSFLQSEDVARLLRADYKGSSSSSEVQTFSAQALWKAAPPTVHELFAFHNEELIRRSSSGRSMRQRMLQDTEGKQDATLKVNVQSVWTTMLMMALLEDQDVMITTEVADSKTVTLVDRAVAFLDDQCQRCQQLKLERQELQARAGICVRAWQTRHQQNILEARNTNADDAARVGKWKGISPLPLRKLRTTHLTISLLMREGILYHITIWERSHLLQTAVLAYFMVAVWAFRVRGASCCDDIREMAGCPAAREELCLGSYPICAELLELYVDSPFLFSDDPNTCDHFPDVGNAGHVIMLAAVTVMLIWPIQVR